MPRPNGLHAQGVRDQLAEMLSRGAERPEMAETFNVHPDTITEWKRDGIVQAKVAKLNQERVNKITARIDNEVERRLKDLEDMDIEVILRIRKELIPAKVQAKRAQGPEHDAVAAAFEKLDEEQTVAIPSGPAT